MRESEYRMRGGESLIRSSAPVGVHELRWTRIPSDWVALTHYRFLTDDKNTNSQKCLV